MKYFILIISLMFVLISCDDDSKKSDSDYVDEYIGEVCNKLYTCDEGEFYRPYYGENESTCVTAMKNSDEFDADCDDINYTNADKCIECTNTLSCEDFFADIESNSCSIYCDNTCNDDIDDNSSSTGDLKSYATAVCTKMFNCEETETYATQFGTVDACVSYIMTEIEAENTCEDINSTALNACISCVENTPCADYFTEDDTEACAAYCNDSICND